MAALTAKAAAEGAFYNVLINMDGFSDKGFAEDARTRAEKALEEVTNRADALTAQIRDELRGV